MSDFALYNNIQKGMQLPSGAGANPGKEKSGGSFGTVLKDAIEQVSTLENGSQQDLQKYLNNDGDLHSVMIALEKADLSFQMMMQVRNKVVSAYQEIMRMQV
jgi:flagellar hook-basal body complex protein FliE